MTTPLASWTPLLAPTLAISFLAVVPHGRAQTATVAPTVETVPVPTTGDAADDSAVWVHPVAPALSLVIGTNKEEGLAVYDLAGTLRQYLPDGELNNVDLRYGFPLGLLDVALVTSGERTNDVIAIYAVSPDTRTLMNVAAGPIALGFDVYGCCMYRSQASGEYYFFGTSEAGLIEQWRLFASPSGGVDAQQVRSFNVGDTVEGCVADDENGWLFLADEDQGIWRYGAEPGAGTAAFLVDTTGAAGNLDADVEGLAIYYASGGGGYLLASSQGSSTFAVYQRAAPHAYVASFQVGANSALGIDAVTGTDGIDVTNRGLGAAFPGGVFVAQDDLNLGANQNFKLVPWPSIAAATNPPLAVDPAYDAHDADCPPPSATIRNGSGVNPPILVNLQPPAIGSAWQATLDCTGHAPSLAFLVAVRAPSSGTLFAGGEVLVDLSSELVMYLEVPHTGNVLALDFPVPPYLILCGVDFSFQAACAGAPGTTLSNAIDIEIGW
ncbi:MAG: phytase [Planctomycetes bacterium]|nr:phytase [Planctomycetota bacterium]